jgi:hypothetical protein
LILSHALLACRSSGKFSCTNLKSRPRILIDEAWLEPGRVGLKVQNAIIGYAIHDSLVFAGAGRLSEGGVPGAGGSF